MEQNDPGLLCYVAVALLVKDLVFPFGLHSNTETLAVLALTWLQYIQRYLSVLKSLTPACLCGPQASRAPVKKKISELEKDLTPNR